MVLEERPFILQLIQQILNFKTWVLSCLKDGPKFLVWHLIYIFKDFLWIYLGGL